MLFCLGEPFSSLITHLRKVEVSCVELVDESRHVLNNNRIKAIKNVANSKGLELTVHAPFVDINIASLNNELRNLMMKRLRKSIVYAHQLDCKRWIFHGGSKSALGDFYPNLDWQLNLRSVRNLLQVARKHNLEIAIENTPELFPFLLKNTQDFTSFFNELGSKIGMTLDVAHAHTCNQASDFIEKFSDKIIHVHISDNEGKYDRHQGIGYGNIDWKTIADALKRINYNGIVTLESIEHVEESLQTMHRLFA